MDDSLCSNFDLLRLHLPDELGGIPKSEFNKITNFDKYCPNNNCDTDLEKITIGFLWLLGKYFTKYPKIGDNEYITQPFFIYIILWLSYKLNQNLDHKTSNINEFYTQHVIGNTKYSNFTGDSNKFTFLEEFINKQKDLLDIDFKDLSKFYDASKLICSMYANKATNTDNKKLLNDATSFVIKYKKLKDGSNTEGTSNNQILSALSNDYDYLKNKCKNVQPLPEITADISALASTLEDASSSSPMGNKIFTVLSIFGAIAFFLGISYKYSLFGFRKRAQKQYIREKIKNIKKKMNR
ncbi:PIR protein [Plasmodium yoelii]|uniref:Yir3 protein n=3 Tax=Plasmodium yoelii TaxID=5861 RepID=Q7RCR9_PLAYO|nr:PIR protein [Plasmodium yoelii]EAA17775.1 putative yir3 protein [Plasmodium yoelii yoelii]WBY54894.1 PIR protein [Plasmodium yoelii yoelii]CDS44887.1 YIR protein [Plasmodium yoelii]VTZ71934.1 PIR protein [Plasmodium yoelii]|eukprot:XP_022811313.1 PIR protein [Plasmodium yoelii]